jgi:hypothetical protein
MPLPIWSFQERRKTGSCEDDPLGHGADGVPLSELKVYILLSGGRWGGIHSMFGRRWILADYDAMFVLGRVFCVETSDSLAQVGPVL